MTDGQAFVAAVFGVLALTILGNIRGELRGIRGQLQNLTEQLAMRAEDEDERKNKPAKT